MITYIFLITGVFFLLIAFALLQVRMFYLNNHPDKYLASYDGHEVFLNRLFLIIRFFMRKIINLFKKAYRNILHIWVRLVEKFSNYSDKIYMRSRNKFMEEVVRDKKAVPHFWNHLKKYKKEIEEEKKIEDTLNNPE